MTTLILAGRKVIPLQLLILPKNRLYDLFLFVNKRGGITLACLGIAIISVICYLVSLYFIFQLGFEIQEKSFGVAKLANNIAESEFTMHERQLDLVHREKDLLKSMEKITTVKYLTPDSTVSFYIPPH